MARRDPAGAGSRRQLLVDGRVRRARGGFRRCAGSSSFRAEIVFGLSLDSDFGSDVDAGGSAARLRANARDGTRLRPADSMVGIEDFEGSRRALGLYRNGLLWIDPHARFAVTLLSNRVHPTRENTLIKAFRPRFHDALMMDLSSETKFNDTHQCSR